MALSASTPLALLIACAPAAPSAPPAAPAAPSAPVAPTQAPTAVPAATQAPNGTAAPASTAQRGGSVKIAVEKLPGKLDPHESTALVEWHIFSHFFEGLLGLDAKGVPTPGLATEFRWSDDRKTLTFPLRKGVRFSNGETVKAADAVASLNRLGKRSSYLKVDWARVVDVVSASDENTVQISLREPYVPLLTYLARPFAAIMPAKVADAAVDRLLKFDELVGTGPYRLRETRSGVEFVLERFDGYVSDTTPPSGTVGQKVAYLDRIVFAEASEPATRVAALQTHDVEIADDIPGVEAARLKTVPGLKLTSGPPLLLAAVLNHHNPPLDNPKIREAITYALDKKAIMLAAADGQESLVELDSNFFRQDRPYYTTAGKQYYERYDPAKAKQLLNEAGYTGQSLVFLTSQERATYYKASLAVKDQLDKVGLNVKIDNYDWQTLLKRRTTAANWHLFPLGTSNYYDPAENAILFVCNSGFYPKYCNPKMDALFAQLNTEPSLEKRKQLWEQVEVLNWQDALYVRYGNLLSLRGVADSLQGFREGEMISLWNVWLRK